jgi:large subunit ribosomal protein L35
VGIPRRPEKLQQNRKPANRFSGDVRLYANPRKGSEMPKLKTKSGAKKRFKISATGKVIAPQAGKRHGMIKRTPKFIRKARGTAPLCEADARIVKKFMPYG